MTEDGSSIASFTCTYAIFINTNAQNVDGLDHVTANGDAAGSTPLNTTNASPAHQTHHTAIFYNAQIHGLNITYPPFGAAPSPPSNNEDPTSTNPLASLALKLKRKALSNPLTTFLTLFGVGIALWAIVLSLKANNLSQTAIDRANFSINLQVEANHWAKLAISWAYWSYNATIVANRITLMGFCAENPVSCLI